MLSLCLAIWFHIKYFKSQNILVRIGFMCKNQPVKVYLLPLLRSIFVYLCFYVYGGSSV